MTKSKLSLQLTELLKKSGDHNPVDVVVELKTEPSNADAQMAELRGSFAKLAEPIKSRITSMGGVVTGEAWLNGTLLARLPQKAMAEISMEADVAHVDLPHPLVRE